jgi:hypothetical protein
MGTLVTIAYVLTGIGFLAGAVFDDRVLSFVLFLVTTALVFMVTDFRAWAFLTATVVGLAALRYQLPSGPRRRGD